MAPPIFTDMNPHRLAVMQALGVLTVIVTETMDRPPVFPYSPESYLPPAMIAAAQRALAYFDLDVSPNSSSPSSDTVETTLESSRAGALSTGHSVGTDHSRPQGLNAVGQAERA